MEGALTGPGEEWTRLAVEVGDPLSFSLQATTDETVTPASLLDGRKALVITGFPLAFTGG